MNTPTFIAAAVMAVLMVACCVSLLVVEGRAARLRSARAALTHHSNEIVLYRADPGLSQPIGAGRKPTASGGAMKYCRALFIMGVLSSLFAILQLLTRSQGTLTLAAIAFVVLFARKGYRTFSAFGTARWANIVDLAHAGMLSGRPGLILGYVPLPRPAFFQSLRDLFDRRIPSDKACERFLRSMHKLQPHSAKALVTLSNALHVAVVAPSGVGKGVSCVVPFLLTSRDSCVVVDFKGENYLLTADARRAMGHQIVVLDPFKVVTQSPDTFNPLDQIETDSPLAIDDCRDLAEALVIRTGQEKDPHWNDSAEMWISAMATVVTQCGDPDNRSLQTIRTLLTDPTKMEAVIKMMCASAACDGMLSRLGNQLTYFKEKELGSVLTTTNRFLRFLDTLAIAECTGASSFDPKDLRTGKMTIYLILPPEHMRAQSSLLRMWVGAMLRAVVRGGLQEKTKVYFVLDEAASLGHMESLDDAVDKYRGYGVRLHFYYQSLGQIRKCFPDGQDQTLLSNVSQVFFGVNEFTTAEYVSNRLGEETIVIESGGTSSGTSRQTSSRGEGSYSTSSNGNDNWAQHGRKLLKPEEVLGLPERIAITFTPGIPPLLTTLVRYYEEGNRGKAPWGLLKTRAEVWLLAISILLASVMVWMWMRMP